MCITPKKEKPPTAIGGFSLYIMGVVIILDDFTLIKHSFQTEPYINIYPIGDVHIGSKECDLELLKTLLKKVEADPFGYIVILGDMLNMALKSSVSNVYEDVLSPLEQKELCYNILKPVKNRILAGCSGNHEYRMVKEVGSNPLYDVFCRLQIENLYRENACFLKLTVGKKGRNPNTYAIVLTHGKSKNKDLSWTYSVDGADVFISGHTHDSLHKPLGKVRIDLRHDKVLKVPYQHIVVIPFQEYGGYAIRGKYMPNCLGQFQQITFFANDKKVSYRYE